MPIPKDTSVVFDSNVYADHLLGPDSTWPTIPPVPPTTANSSADAVSLAFDGTFRLYASSHILTNLARVARATGISAGTTERHIAAIVEMCAFSGGQIIDPVTHDHGIRDYEDNPIISLAIDDNVDAFVIVTRDRDLLDVGPAWRGRLIMHPADFVREIVR